MTADGPDDGTFSSLARKARRRLPRLFADYIDGGAHGEHTLHRNRAAFTRWSVTPRGLRDVSSIDLTTTCFGRTWRLPFFLAPVGFAGMFHAQGEAATAHMAARHSIGMGISTFSIAAMEDLVASEADLMAQIYVMRDRAVTRDLLERAKTVACPASSSPSTRPSRQSASATCATASAICRAQRCRRWAAS